MNNRKEKGFLRNLGFAFVVILIYKLVDILPWSLEGVRTLFSILTPIISGFIIAFVLCAPASKIEGLFKRLKPTNFFNKHSRGFSILLTYLLFIGLIALLIYAVIPIFMENVYKIADNSSFYYTQLKEYIEQFIDENGMLFGLLNVEEFFSNDVPNAIKTFFNTENILSIFNGAAAVVSAIVSFFISAIISIYMLSQRESLISACGKILGIFMRGKTVSAIHSYLKRIAAIFYSYIYGQLLDAFIVSIVFMIFFSIVGVPYSVFFAILLGICNLIPYFGAIIGGVLVSLVTLATEGFTPALIVAAGILVAQQLDGNILQPRIVGQSVGMKPIYVLMAITVGGGFFGFLGILISVPLVATLRMIFIDLIEFTQARRKRKTKAEKE